MHDGFALKICTIKRVQPLGTEGCPVGTQPLPPGTPDTGETCAAYACPEDPAAPAGPHSVHLPANTADPITDLVYPYVWHDQTGEYLPAFAVRDSNANHGGPGTDNSVYHLSMLKFVQTDSATFDVQRLETSLISRLNDFETHPDDLFGDGLQDLVTSAGCPGIDVVNGMQGTSGYWSHKVCSAVDDNTYGPTALDGQTAASLAVNQALIGSINVGIGSMVYCPQGVAAPTLGALGLSGQVDLKGLPDVLVGDINGVGDCAVWVYAPLGLPTPDREFALYTIPSQNGYVDSRHYYFTSSMPVVADMVQNDGTGGNLGFRSSAYGYTEAMYNHFGRGFQGFRSIIDETSTQDANRSIRTTTTFHQKFPLTGKVELVVMEAPNAGVTFQTEADTWICGLSDRSACPEGDTLPIPTENTVRAPMLDEQHVVRSDLTSGAATSDIDTVNAASPTAQQSGWDPNGNGNLLRQWVNSADGMAGLQFVHSQTTTTTNHYATPTNDWWIDKLNDTTVTAGITYNTTNHPLPGGGDPPSRTVTTSYQWNPDRTPESRTMQGDTQSLTTSYAYPATSYGLPSSVTVSGTGISPSRTTEYVYTKDGTSQAADGYFVLRTTKVLAQTT
ncbi:MAG: hypothetical protein WBW61_08935, partial [Rhodanobacteraceae bacterium]